jgi:hypothetical protein
MDNLYLHRFIETEESTSSILFNENRFLSFCLELPYRNNERFISCIPVGCYSVVPHDSPKFGECFLIEDVPNRDHILFHVGNYAFNTTGCILPGRAWKKNMVTESQITMTLLLALFPDGFNLTITEVQK